MKQSQIFIASSDIYIYIEELIKIINFNYIKRLLIQYGHNIIKLAYIPEISNDILYNKASKYLNLTENKIPKTNNIKTFKQLISNFLVDIQYNEKKTKENKKNYQNNISIKSGFKKIDKLTTGLTKGDIIVLAGRPSMGKTSLAINIAYNISYTLKSSVSIFSLEMSSKQILNKFISIACNISTQEINLHNLSIQKWNNIKKKCKKLLDFNIYINDKPNISIDYIEYNSKLLQKEDININLIIIDYLQLIQINNVNNITRSQELSYITRKIKLLAQYLNLPIII
uniref:Replication helicase subunit n=1 Tax=Erythroglossum lusitanicum TaxID=2575615 RepID=A0A4D6WRU7_9FLOR|nr:replication helicase subunit [Erythroglossum lusitanicum]